MNRLTRSDISYSRATGSGAWVLSALVSGYYVENQFMGYTKEQATKLFMDRHK